MDPIPLAPPPPPFIWLDTFIMVARQWTTHAIHVYNALLCIGLTKSIGWDGLCSPHAGPPLTTHWPQQTGKRSTHQRTHYSQNHYSYKFNYIMLWSNFIYRYNYYNGETLQKVKKIHLSQKLSSNHFVPQLLNMASNIWQHAVSVSRLFGCGKGLGKGYHIDKWWIDQYKHLPPSSMLGKLFQTGFHWTG